MKSFQMMASRIVVEFDCPTCGNHLSIPIDELPQPNMAADHVEDSEASQDEEIECDVCHSQFQVEVFVNMNDGNVEVMNLTKGKVVEDITVKVTEEHE